jgi:TRAP transporter TAXI family solute receptor
VTTIKSAPPRITEQKKIYPFGLNTLMELFDIGPVVALTVLGLALLLIVGGVFFFIHSAPPTTITISSGPEGSSFYKSAMKYAKVLESNGVQLNVLKSEGSLENFQRISDPKARVDIAFVQAGISEPSNPNLVSLGSIAYQPVLIFYRGKPMELLSELQGKRVSTGPKESGTHKFAMSLLKANGITDKSTTEFALEAQEAATELQKGTLDAAFIMSESASSDILHTLMRSKDIRLFDFKQANAYSRKIDYLNVLNLPEGAIDFGLNIPPHDVALVGSMVELITTKQLHPALSDILLEAAVSVHSRPGVFQSRGEFPAPIEHAIPVSSDANRFYKSGKSLLYRYLPFWLASLTSRIVVVFVPMLVVLIPAMKSIPAFFRWRTQNKIYSRYRDLLILENEIISGTDTTKQEVFRDHFDRIEEAVNKMKIPAAFADQFYGLRGHIDYVRSLVEKRTVS